MEKILCAIDETEVSRGAEAYAAKMAKALKAELCYVYVSPVSEDDLGEKAWQTIMLDVMASREHEVLKYARDVADSHGLNEAECIVLRSPKVVSTIVDFAEKRGFTLIIVGSTGREGVPRFILGSTAGGIIHKAHCPVMVVR